MQTLLLYTLLCTACFYLGSRALITRWLWSNYSPGIARFMDCSACTGFWYGWFWSLVLGDLFGQIFMGNAIIAPSLDVVFDSILVGLCMMVLTPLGAGLMQHALAVVGSAVDVDSNE